jgi:hypothetical protein
MDQPKRNRQAVQTDTVPRSSWLEPHFTVAEVAELWNLSRDAVRDIFRHEDGVLATGTVKLRGTRGYVTLRIPASVLERVHRQMSLSNQYRKR